MRRRARWSALKGWLAIVWESVEQNDQNYKNAPNDPDVLEFE